MFKDVGDSGRISWHGLKCHAEGVLGVVVADMNMSGLGVEMFKLIVDRIDLFKLDYSLNMVAVKSIA